MALDFSTIKPQDAELPKVTSNGGAPSKYDNNPFVEWVRESYANKKGKKIDITKADVPDAIAMIRNAAKQLGCGVRIVPSLKGEQFEKASASRKVSILFQGQDKKAYSPRKKKNAVETPAAPVATDTAAPVAAPDGATAAPAADGGTDTPPVANAAQDDASKASATTE